PPPSRSRQGPPRIPPVPNRSAANRAGGWRERRVSLVDGPPDRRLVSLEGAGYAVVARHGSEVNGGPRSAGRRAAPAAAPLAKQGRRRRSGRGRAAAAAAVVAHGRVG